MNQMTEARWATAVRVLALLTAVSIVTAALEAKAIRGLRSEQQMLRTAREEAKAGIDASWAAMSADELEGSIRWLNTFYRDAGEGFGQPGGLCAAGELNARDLARFAAGAFLPARASGQSMAESIDTMKTAIRRTAEYRALHPDLGLPDK
jgi:hypothetical protein